MDPFKINPNGSPRTKRGEAREEYYNGVGKPKEQFGLAKRARRSKRGIQSSLPNGSWPKSEGK